MPVSDFTRWGTRWRRWTGQGRQPPAEQAPGVLLGRSEDGREVLWPAPSSEHASHGLVFAASGAGKTVLDAAARVREIAAGLEGPPDLRPAYLIVDPKGDYAAAFLAGLAAEAPQALDEVRILDPFDLDGGFPFNLNRLPQESVPVDIRAMQLAALTAAVSTATGEQSHLGAGARQLDVLQHALLGSLASDHPEASVLWALDALTDPKGLAQLSQVTKSERAKRFLDGTKLAEELRVSCASRLRAAFAATEHLERLVCAPGCIRWDECLAPGRVTIVDLGRPTGGFQPLQPFWANLVVRTALDHLLERPSPYVGHHVRVIIDEAQIVAPVLSTVAETLLTTGRSRGLSLIVASQGTTLIRDASETLLRVLLTNAPIKVVGRLAAADAELLARELAPQKGSETPLAAQRARFVAAVTNLEDRQFFRLMPGEHVRFRSADVDLEAWAAAESREAARLQALRRALAVPLGTKRLTLAEAAGRLAPAREGRARRRARPRQAGPARSQTAPGAPEKRAQGPDARPQPRSRWG